MTLAPDLAEAHSALGVVKLYYERDWDGAERAFRRANELDPNLSGNRYHDAWCLFIRDRVSEAIAEHERARDLDAFTPRNTSWLAMGPHGAAHRPFQERSALRGAVRARYIAASLVTFHDGGAYAYVILSACRVCCVAVSRSSAWPSSRPP